ncbi:hypothetical protein PTTG_29214 [Puccinia triticina 1-1 BBBD Race 1]|uniref:Uncharacterized protein n=1 Tax=Puccinia triticina (isolate 1-1 / race 1 (BBBD)) TaxID=630390 RepID=A0A180G6G3_PUCT1|nr:hypothetical protein PTTG_29214 [Puccinia triticina 1-1 BBBD Race 1]
MSRKTYDYRLNGRQSRSIRVHNKQMSAWLPSSNSAFCQSVYDFIKLLINNELSISVPDDQLSTAQALRKDQLKDQTSFLNCDLSSYKPECAGKKKSISTKYKVIFLYDLKQVNLTHNNFDYTQDAICNWNTTFIELLCKHWTYAESQNAFSAYPINVDDIDLEKLYGVILRWFNGKKVRFSQKKHLDPAKTRNQRRNWQTRTVLMNRRVASLKLLGISAECCKPFEEPFCHSDTEELEDATLRKVNLPWRSPALAALCNAADKMTLQRTCPAKIDRRLLETRRLPATKSLKQAKVPMNLPGDSYDPEFMKSLSEHEQKDLTRTPPSGLAEFYCKIVRDHPDIFNPTQFPLL